MFASLLVQEVRHRLRQLSTHVYFAIFFGVSFLLISALGGAFTDANITIFGMGPNTHANSPFAINATTLFVSLLGLMITAPFMGQSVYRDYESGIHPLVFSTPVSKAQYLGSRFLGACLVHLYLYAGLTAGLMLGAAVPWVDPSQFGDFRLMAYLQPYLLYILPNLLWVGGLFVALPAFTRRMLPNYIGGVLLFMGYNIAAVLIGGDALQNSTVASIVDPFGLIPTQQLTRYWTAAEQNAQLVPLEGMLLLNRALWLGLGVALIAGLYAGFRFAHLPGRQSGGGDETSDDGPSLAEVTPTSLIHAVDLPEAALSDSWGARLRQFASIVRRSFLYVVRDVYFYAIVGASVIFLVVAASQSGQINGTPVQPVTYHVVGQLGSQFFLFMVILITFYAGQLVWRERDVEVQQVHDTLPLPTSVTLSAKGVALGLVCAVLMLVVLGAGVATQLSYGFTDLNLSLYLTELYGAQLTDYLLYAALALTVHAVVNHKYLGHFIVVAFFLALGFSSQLGIEHTLWQYGSDPGLPYSAMNEYGHFAGAFMWHKLLWAAVALAMATIARLAWVRGEESTLGVRLRQAQRRLSPAVWGTLGVAGVVAFGTGAYIYVNTTVWNTFRTSSEQTDLRAQYEKTYERYADTPQPRIDAADLDVDLYPSRRDARLAGTYVLTNGRSVPIDTVFIETPAGADVDQLDFGREAETVRYDETYGVRLVHLSDPLAPGDSTTLTFDTWLRNDGFTSGGGQTSIVHNGTFINSGELPRIGYDEGAELSDRSQREDHGLKPKPRMHPQSDTSARMRPYVARDATWLDYKATVSTSANQVPLATGTRDSAWTAGGRRHVRFRTTAPTEAFFSFLSARYEEATGTWTPPYSSLNRGRPVDIEVFHHPTHDYNTGRMVDAVKRSLTYYTRHFGPYQSREVRIAEFPRYAGFAQSFLGTIPYSESIGFIARVDPETDIDYPYYVTAHEMGHQWWGHQVVSGPVWGATMLVESLAQYSALMVMEETYGRGKMKRFLEYELDDYLSGRSLESREERPLMTAAATQGYIHYEKGSLAMYALKEYLGEETVNRVLREFLWANRYQSPPFVTSEALVERFEAAAPDSLEGFVEDLFRDITLYDNRATGATYTKTEDGRYRVTLTIEARKQQADSIGTSPTEAPMDLPVEIGVFAEESDVGAEDQQALYRRKHRLTSGTQDITVTVGKKPARAGVDPFTLLIDRETEDNMTAVTQAE
ncbi:M1 family aminopeptidase [Salinibacter altiplanensis]|uniref:M1 family aminopeptidase n=1 Tax=Salinibacter altiplanensis TaxID=1803181 RepID=UPI000C9F1E13|nr:M1 family aminopeptidase [Salinibacter altiplanensis]